MSKAFTKGDNISEPVFVPERAPLPPGVPNYVTERGMRLLEEERKALIAQRARLGAAEDQSDDDAAERRNQLAVVNRRLRDLTERITTARTIVPPDSADRTVRFGATVTLRPIMDEGAGKPLRITLVGVDEAGQSASLVAFCAPIAKAILGHKPGDRITHRKGSGEELLEILDVEYKAASDD